MENDNVKYDSFIQSRESQDEIYKYHRRNRIPVHWMNSGKFGLFIKFQKEIYKLFRQVNITSPSAIRIFMYLIECCIGYDEDPKSEIPLNAKKIISECNIKSRKSFYDALHYLRDRDMIFVLEKECGKVIRLNSSILLWNIEEENRKVKIYRKELDRLTTR